MKKVKEIKITIDGKEIALSEESLRNIRDALKEKSVKDETVERWKPKVGETAYCLDPTYFLPYDEYISGAIGAECAHKNYADYKNEEEAKLQAEKELIRRQLDWYAKAHNGYIERFRCGKGNWHFYFNTSQNEMMYSPDFGCGFDNAYFASEQIARGAVKFVGEERIKKYLFEVE